MKISFQYSNGTSTLTLIPDSEREKALIRLFAEGRQIKLGASIGLAPESLVITTEIEPKQVNALPASVLQFTDKIKKEKYDQEGNS